MKVLKIIVLTVLTFDGIVGFNSAILAGPSTKPSIGRDFVNQGKSIGRGIGSAFTYLFKGGQGIVSKHGRAWHLEAIAAGMVGYALYNYYGRIQRIAKKYPEKQGPEIGKLSLWGMKSQWASHVDIISKQDEFLNSLESAKRVRRDDNQQEIIDILNQEYEEIENDIAYLEKFFVEYFKLPEWLGGSHGIKRNYDQVLENRNLSNVATNDWTQEEFNMVDQDMKRLCHNKWYHYALFKINYGNAAALWWKLQKLMMRLDAIRHIWTPVEAHMSKAPHLNRDLSSRQGRSRSRPNIHASVGTGEVQR